MGRTIKANIKRIASLILATATLISVVPQALANPADDFSDFPTGWSRPAMEAAVNNGLLMGIGGDKIGPEKNLTRAEMAAVMVRAFGATTKADISKFTDLDEDSWYYDSIASAVKMGALAGISNNEMAPTDYITREQVFSVLARILALNGNNAAVLYKFKDRASISSWALSTVIPMVERGYVNGDDLGNINPKSYITREEFAQVMYTTIKKYITEAGTYDEDLEGIVVLRTGDITLDGVTVSGDLVVGDGAAKDLVILNDVDVNGRLLTRGGTIELAETDVRDGVVVLNPNGVTRFNNYRIEKPFEDIIEHTEASFLTRVPGSSGPVGQQITVNFYRGFGQTMPIGTPVTLTLSGGVASVPSSQIPDTSVYYWDGDFKASDYMPNSYSSLKNEYRVAPSFWYQDGGVWKPFDHTVQLTQSTNVYLMYREVSLSVLGANIFARYDENARFMDTAKVLAHQTYKALLKAKNDGLPLYDSLDANIKDIFSGTGLVEEVGVKQYLKPFLFPLALNNALDEADVKDVIEDRIVNLKTNITNPGSVETLLKWPGVDEYLVAQGISASDTSAIISHVSGLTDVSGINNEIYDTPEYSGVIAAINNNSDFDVKPSNLELLKAIHDELEIITFDTVMGMGSGSAISGMVSVVGYDVCRDIFDGGREVYCGELSALIGAVENGGANETIPAAFTLIFDLVGDVLRPLYERAETGLVNKFSASLRYSQNPYLQYLVNDHDVISEMFGYDGTVPAGQEKVRTGYYIKDLTEYAKYMVKLLIATDDALCWYGNLSDTEFEAVYNAVFADIYDVHDRLEQILTDFYYHDDLPDTIESALASVQQLNDIFMQIKPALESIVGVYLDSSIYDDLSDGTLGEKANTKKLVDILTGREDLTFNVDRFYTALGNNEGKIQALLGNLGTSIDDIADLLKNRFGVRDDVVDGLVNFINSVAANGLSQYRVQNPAGATTVDEYRVTFGGKTIILRRSFEG